MPSTKHLRPDQLVEIRAIPESWFQMYTLRDVEVMLANRFRTTRYQIRHALLANEIEHEWSKKCVGIRRSKEQ